MKLNITVKCCQSNIENCINLEGGGSQARHHTLQKCLGRLEMIEEIEITQFQGLSDFKLTHIAQFNVISGLNGSGKTSLLNAVHSVKSSELVESQDSDDLRFCFKDVGKTNPVKLTPSREDTYKNSFMFNSQQMSLLRLINMLNSVDKQDDITKILTILRHLREFDENLGFVEGLLIEGFELSLVTDSAKIPISQLSNSTYRFLSMITVLVLRPKSILLIDEIESGLHPARYLKMLSILFELAYKQKSQIFCTTYSLEMIKDFIAMTKKRKPMYFENLYTYFEVCRHKVTGKIKAIEHRLDTLEFEVSRNIRIMGD